MTGNLNEVEECKRVVGEAVALLGGLDVLVHSGEPALQGHTQVNMDGFNYWLERSKVEGAAGSKNVCACAWACACGHVYMCIGVCPSAWESEDFRAC